MTIQTKEYYHAVVVEVRGRFVGYRGQSLFLQALDELRAVGRSRVVIDLSRTELMDSTALGALIRARQEMLEAGGDVRLAGIGNRLRSLFLMTHLLGRIFEDYASMNEALQSYAPLMREVAAN